MIAGGVESISGARALGTPADLDPWLVERKPELFMAMIDTADVVAKRYGISREDQDAFSLLSQQRTAAAQEKGLFANEIIACAAHGREEQGHGRSHLPRCGGDQGQLQPPRHHARRPGQAGTREGRRQLHHRRQCLAAVGWLQRLRAHGSQAGRAPGPATLGAFRGMAVAGCEPDEMGIGPVFAVPKLLQRHGLKVEDIDLWELNEAFASQALYCQRQLGIPLERLNVNGGAISIGHPFGMTGARLAGHILLEGSAARPSTAW
jgi:acetyl-CoA C-acetyltransferase